MSISLFLKQPQISLAGQQQLPAVLAELKPSIFLVPSTHLLLPNKHGFSTSHQNISDFRKIQNNILLCDILHLFSFPKIPFLPQMRTFLFICRLHIELILTHSLLLALWHPEYGEWFIILSLLQLNNQITIYGTNTATGTMLSSTDTRISKPRRS